MERPSIAEWRSATTTGRLAEIPDTRGAAATTSMPVPRPAPGPLWSASPPSASATAPTPSPAPPAPSQAAARPLDAPAACDRKASHPDDPEAVTAGVRDERLDAQGTILACEGAVKADSSTPRLHFQLARGYLTAGRLEDGIEQLLLAAQEGHGASLAYLADIHLDGAAGIKPIRRWPRRFTRRPSRPASCLRKRSWRSSRTRLRNTRRPRRKKLPWRRPGRRAGSARRVKARGQAVCES